MNINREMVDAFILTYSEEIDAYGQTRKGTPTKTPVKVTRPKIYTHYPTEDIRFNDVTHSCLTFSKNITEENELEVNEVVYLVKFVNPEGRLAQVFVTKK